MSSGCTTSVAIEPAVSPATASTTAGDTPRPSPPCAGRAPPAEDVMGGVVQGCFSSYCSRAGRLCVSRASLCRMSWCACVGALRAPSPAMERSMTHFAVRLPAAMLTKHAGARPWPPHRTADSHTHVLLRSPVVAELSGIFCVWSREHQFHPSLCTGVLPSRQLPAAAPVTAAATRHGVPLHALLASPPFCILSFPSDFPWPIACHDPSVDRRSRRCPQDRVAYGRIWWEPGPRADVLYERGDRRLRTSASLSRCKTLYLTGRNPPDDGWPWLAAGVACAVLGVFTRGARALSPVCCSDHAPR